MADSQSSRMLNPGVLHLQKLGLELKCPSCLEPYNKPVLLPCNHIFCGSCVPKPGSLGLECAICKHSFLNKDIRQASFMESIVNIYRSLYVTFSAHMQQMAFVGGSHSHSPLTPCSLIRPKPNGQPEAVELDVSQLNQLSQGSPPFFGVNSSDHRSGEDSLERQLVKKPNKRIADEFTSNEVHSSTNHLVDNYAKIFKKSKQDSNGLVEMLDVDSPQMVTNSKDSMDSGAKMISESIVSSDSKAVHTSNSMSSPHFICGFCQTWKVTEHTGPILHYVNEKSVVGEAATGFNVVHVHNRCIEWAPQIYYVDENVKNLNKELQRGAKLKCSKCKLKGAALGCYAKSCKRSYHVPCAAEISECRWDTDNFLMLCPAHASLRFPSEKSRKHNSAKQDIESDIPAQIAAISREPEKLNFWASPTGAKNWVFCGSSLSVDEKCMLIKFASLCGATVMRSWTPNVTHVIAAIDETGACTRTRKVLMAILKGKWVLKIDWMKACMEMNSPVDEEAYEISLDNHGCHDGPKIGRLRVLSNARKLFSGLKFLFTGEFIRTYMEDLQGLILTAGGTLLESKEQLREQDDNATEFGSNTSGTRLIVYNCDSSMGPGGGLDVLQRQLDAEVLAAETWSQAIPHTWLLDSIASCNLQPFAQQ